MKLIKVFAGIVGVALSSQPLMSWAADQGTDDTANKYSLNIEEARKLLVHPDGDQHVVVQYDDGTEYEIVRPGVRGVYTMIPVPMVNIDAHTGSPQCTGGGGLIAPGGGN